MRRVTMAGIRGHRLRFLLTSLSVLLGVAFVAGTLVLTDSLDRTFTGIFSQANKGTDVYVSGAEGATSMDGTNLRSGLPLTLESELERLPDVRRAAPELAGSAILVGKDGTAVRNGGAPTLSFPWLDDDPVLEVVDGRAPRGPGEIAVEEGTLEKAGLTLGDRTRVVVGPRVMDVSVVASVKFGALAGATLVLFDEPTAVELFAPDGTTSAFQVQAKPGVSQEALVKQVQPVLPPNAEAITGEAKTERDTAAMREALGFINTFLLVFAGISLIVGGFIIVNTFSMLLAQRTRELALLRAIGAGAGQVVRMVLAEAAAIGLIGGLVGLGAGVGLAAALQAAMSSFGLEVSGGLPVSARTVIVSLLLGLVVTVVAAAVPAVRASRIAPVAAMRDDVAMPEKGLRRRAVWAVALLLLGLAAVVPALRLEGAGSDVSQLAVVLLLFAAFAVGAPALARPVIAVVGAPFAALSRSVGRMARGNALRNPRRTAATASALMIGLALVSAVSVLSASATESTKSLVNQLVRADLVLEGGFTGMSDGISEAVRKVDGVKSVAGLGAVPLDMDGAPQLAVGIDAAALGDAVDVQMRSGALDALDDGKVLVSESQAKDEDLAVGSTLSGVVGTLADQSLTVGGVFADNPAIGSSMVVPAKLAERAVPAPQRADMLAYVVLDAGADAAKVRAAVVDTVKPYVVVSVQDRDEFINSQSDQIEQLLMTIYVLLALSVVIAVLGIVNTLALSVFERTREIGLLRAVGLSRSQLRRMITLESVYTALFGALLGAVLGLGIGVFMQRILVDEGLTDLVVPTGSLVTVLVLSAVVGVVAAVLPAVRATRLNILKAISVD
ncbi:MAG TPA: FtsX-like permease family protein [Actinomycetales bacterium]|nr:FtsX-like permease family protein [Actinomycetales bacterium]